MVDCTCGNSEGEKGIHHQWASVWEVVSHYSMYPKIKKRTAQLNDSSSSFKSFVFPVIYYRYSPMLNPWGLAPNPNRSIALGMPGVRPGRVLQRMSASIGQGAIASEVAGDPHMDRESSMVKYSLYVGPVGICLKTFGPPSLRCLNWIMVKLQMKSYMTFSHVIDRTLDPTCLHNVVLFFSCGLGMVQRCLSQYWIPIFILF
jgi:hypothetical protein